MRKQHLHKGNVGELKFIGQCAQIFIKLGIGYEKFDFNYTHIPPLRYRMHNSGLDEIHEMLSCTEILLTDRNSATLVFAKNHLIKIVSMRFGGIGDMVAKPDYMYIHK
jgi:hypothetical protein